MHRDLCHEPVGTVFVAKAPYSWRSALEWNHRSLELTNDAAEGLLYLSRVEFERLCGF
jgi:hypothetical protein